MKRRFKDFYGCTASIAPTIGAQARLKEFLGNGRLIHNKTYNTERGARIAMGRMSDCWEEVRKCS